MKKKSFIGVDISKSFLDIVLFVGGGKLPKENYLKIKNNPEGIKEFAQWIKQKRIKPSSILLCMEYTGIYTLDFCLYLEKRKIDYSLVSPLHIKPSQGLTRGKNDKVDALRIATYCYLHRESITLSKLKDSTLLRLKELMSEYKLYVRQQAAHKGLQTDRKNRPCTPSTLRGKKTAAFLQEIIRDIKEEMIREIEKDPSLIKSFKLLNTIVGIGPINAIATILHTDNFQGFDSPRQYACYLGVAPFEYQSGSSVKGKTRVSKLGAKALKDDLSQAAKSATQHDIEMIVYYVRKKAEGKPLHVTI